MGGASYKCPECGKWFLAMGALREHHRQAHADLPPEVLNARDYTGSAWPPGSISIMRGTPYGNPYKSGRDGTREDVIARYIAEKSRDPAFITLVRSKLRGRHLVCACKPKACHGDWLLKIANAPLTELNRFFTTSSDSTEETDAT
ncbi:hypothetical protein KIKIMORA_02100 [Brevundimonas phage vB_BpoS-Kikimora]|uniref:C2H2-type domain-containing protein n=1 Tax=Brevundimonas phage vB_BpoS-Kikimora TaxID=2948601 RepID=A0A9E7SL29_9CAUD|nr:hypothetical protein KIKIMORA_02100 [Brevundimonas phage vB_BpoS-Kikimora]